MVDEALRGADPQALAQRGEARGLVARFERDLGLDDEAEVLEGLRGHVIFAESILRIVTMAMNRSIAPM